MPGGSNLCHGHHRIAPVYVCRIGPAIHMISGLSLAIRLSDIFKAVYLSWFAYEFGKFFPGRLKLIKLILLNLLAFGTFRIWRLHSVPHCKMDNEINLHAKTPEETCPGKLLVKAEAS